MCIAIKCAKSFLEIARSVNLPSEFGSVADGRC